MLSRPVIGPPSEGLGVGRHILHALLVPFGPQRQGLIDQQIQRQIQLVVQRDVGKIDVCELVSVEQAFQTTCQPFAEARVAGTFILHPVIGGDTIIPAAIP